jgi:RNA polymerase sigma factor (TIGR02999 family)
VAEPSTLFRDRLQNDSAQQAGKRGGGAVRLSLDEGPEVPATTDINLMELDAALDKLEKIDPQQGRVVELRYFGGLSIEETAEALHISPATVKRDWTMAKAWLMRELRHFGE